MTNVSSACLYRLHVVFAVPIFNLYFEYALVGSNCCFIDSFVDRTISANIIVIIIIIIIIIIIVIIIIIIIYYLK